jgi:hypothetical protein
MNPEVKRLWVDALRSGEYQQGQGALFTGEGYCCLGVLCEVAIKAGLEIEKSKRDSEHWLYDGEAAWLPQSVEKWAGLPDASPDVSLGFERRGLVQMNDGDLAPFSAIADAIENDANF